MDTWTATQFVELQLAMVVALWLQFTAHFNVCMETKALINLRNIITNGENQNNEAGNKFGVEVF